MGDFPDPYILSPQGELRGTIVMLHGRGSTGEEFGQDLFETKTSTNETFFDLLPGYKWVFPTSRTSLDSRFKEEMSQWYDIYSLVDTEAQATTQLDGLKASVAYLAGLVEREARSAVSGKIVLGGISQGWTIAVLVALLGHQNIQAMVGFSSWLPLYSTVSNIASFRDRQEHDSMHKRTMVAEAITSRLALQTTNIAPPDTFSIYLGHCIDDEMVDVEHGRRMCDVLSTLGHDVVWEESIEGGHWINEPRGMDGLKAFLEKLCLSSATVSSSNFLFHEDS